MVGPLGQFVLRDWRLHKARFVLTLLGVALGVAVFFAIQTTNFSLVNSLTSTVEKLGGKATLQVVGGEAGFSRDLIKTVRSVPGVLIAEPVLETVTSVAGKPQKVLVLGLDTESDLRLYSQTIDESSVLISDPIAFQNSTDAVAICEPLRDRLGLKTGDKFTVDSASGPVQLTVRGKFKPKGIGDVYDGNVAVMDLYAAEKVFNRGQRIDRIDIMNDPAVSPDELAERLTAALGSGVEVTRPDLRGKDIENAVTTLHSGLTIISVFAITLAVFLVFNSFSISVSQRWKDIAILRALGVERYRISVMFLAESLLLGILGSALGVGLGLLVSITAVDVVVRVTSLIYGVVESPAQVVFDWSFGAEAFALGIAASLIGAGLPARRAANLEPVTALRNVEVRATETSGGWLRPIIGIMLLATGLCSTAFLPALVGSYLQLVFSSAMLTGVVLLLPNFLRTGAKLLRPVMGRLFGIEGVIAVETMASAPRRSVATIAAIAIGLCFVFSNAALIRSLKSALNRSVDKAIAADVLITSTEQLHSRTVHFSEATAKSIAALPEVQDADLLRVTVMQYQGREVTILAHEMDNYFKISPDLLDAGDETRAREMTSRGEGILISNNMSLRWGLKMGDELPIPTPKGEIKLPIVGMLDYYRSEFGTVFLDRELYKRYWDDTDVDYMFLDLKPGVDRVAFKEKAQAAIAGIQKAFIYTHDEYKVWVTQLIDQFFFLMYIQMFVAVVTAFVGLVNTMLVSTAERTRELGIIRAVGGSRRQVVRMVLLESLAIALIGLAGALFAGVLNGYFLIKTAAKIVAGFNLPLTFPLDQAAIALPVLIVVALLSAWLPAYRAANSPVVEAIGYE